MAAAMATVTQRRGRPAGLYSSASSSRLLRLVGQHGGRPSGHGASRDGGDGTGFRGSGRSAYEFVGAAGKFFAEHLGGKMLTQVRISGSCRFSLAGGSGIRVFTRRAGFGWGVRCLGRGRGCCRGGRWGRGGSAGFTGVVGLRRGFDSLRCPKGASGPPRGVPGHGRGHGGRRQGRDNLDGGGPDVVGGLFGDFQHHDRDVVRGAGLEGEINQQFDAFAQVPGLPDGALHDVAGHVVQAVGTEQPALTRFDVKGIQVQFRARVDVAQDPHQDVLVRMRFRLLGPEPAFIDEALDEGVVHADLFEFAVPQPVRAGIANMGEVQLAFGQEEGCDGGAHARQLGIDVHEFGEQRIGGLDLVGQDGAGVAVVVVLVEMDHVQHCGG